MARRFFFCLFVRCVFAVTVTEKCLVLTILYAYITYVSIFSVSFPLYIFAIVEIKLNVGLTII